MSIEALDKLTPLQRTFVNCLCSGMSGVEAYLEASETKSRKSAYRKASELKQNPKVAAAIDAVNEVLQFRGVASKEEVAHFLTRAINEPLSVIDADSPLAQEIIEEQSEDGGKTKIKKVDTLKAADMLNKLMGYYEPEKVDLQSKGLADLLNKVRSED